VALTDIDVTERAPDKLNVVAEEGPPPDLEPLKARIAERVRADSRERRRLTRDEEVRVLVPELERDELSRLLAGMAEQGLYGDIKAVVAPSGRVYLFSEKHLIAAEAAELGRIEEARHAVADRIRADSSRIALTPAADLEPLFPFPEPERRAAFMAEVLADERFEDLQVTKGPKGEVYYHSDRHVSGNYAAVMTRAKAGDALFAIAEFVRHNSRIMPAPVCLTAFRDPVFGILQAKLDGFVEKLLETPAYADVKRLVHRETGAVYLYSDRYLDELRATEIMDWNEVGALRNP